MMKKVIDYLLSNDLAEIPKRGRNELKSIIIDNRKFRYNKDKPISNVLTKKLLSVKNTNEYRNYAMKKATDQLITKHAIRNKFRVRDIQSAFRRYANSIVLENKHFQGERGLEMIAHQKQRLSEFLSNNRNMKLNIRTERLFEKTWIWWWRKWIRKSRTCICFTINISSNSQWIWTDTSIRR